MFKKNFHIFFSIESSCDDMCFSLYMSTYGIIKSLICHQNSVHKFYGGIVPQLASICHKMSVFSLYRYMLLYIDRNINKFFFTFTKGPGFKYSLRNALLLCKFIFFSFRIPFFALNHLEGHVFSAFLGKEKKLIFPFLSFIISGGHTIVIRVSDCFFSIILGKGNDDSIGELFDKIARSFGFWYPGAFYLEKNALYGFFLLFLEMKNFFFNSKSFFFSFSGFKTYFFFLSYIFFFTYRNIKNLSFFFEYLIFFLLFCVYKNSVNYTYIKDCFFVGGVSTNTFLKKYFFLNFKKQIFFPFSLYSSDNAAMVNVCSYFKFLYYFL